MHLRHFVIAIPLLVACGGESPQVDQPFLWEVAGEGGPTYFLGTMHLGVTAEELPDIVWRAYDSTQTLIVESDTRESASSDDLEVATLPEGQALSDMMSDDMWADLTAIFVGASPDALDRLQPWVVSAMLAQSLRPEGEAMDRALTVRAAAEGREIVFLEDLSAVAAKFDDIPPEQSIMEIAVMLYQPQAYLDGIQRMIQLYRWGDVAAMRDELWGIPQDEAQPDETSADESTSDDVLLRGRNLDWLPAIEEHVQEGHAFVAVGLAHLIGPDNLLDMLADQGLSPTRMLKHAQLGQSTAALRETRYRPPIPALARTIVY